MAIVRGLALSRINPNVLTFLGLVINIGAALLLLEALTLASRSARQVVVAAGLLTVGFFALAPLAVPSARNPKLTSASPLTTFSVSDANSRSCRRAETMA